MPKDNKLGIIRLTGSTSCLLLSILAKHYGTNQLSHTIIDYGPEGILTREESGVRVAAKLRTNAPAIFQPSGGSPPK